MKKNKILAIELWMQREQHLQFNKSILEVISIVFPDYDIFFEAEKNHINSIKKILKCNCICKSIVMPQYNLIFLPIFDFIISFYVIKILLRSNKNDIILLTNRLPFSHFLFKICNFFFNRIALLPLHGEMEAIINPQKVGYTKYYFKLFDKLAFLIKNKYTQYIILGESIKKEIQSKIKFNQKQIITIDHPYDFSKSYSSIAARDILKIGFIGRLSPSKNGGALSFVIQKLEKELNAKQISIQLIGSIDRKIWNKNSDLASLATSSFISANEYETRILSIDYILSFIDDKVYKAIPSGTFFDALKYEKPIIGLKGNTFIDYYFSKLGNIGYLCKNIDDMITFLQKLSKNYNNNYINYAEQVNNIKQAKSLFSIQEIATSFKHQFHSNLGKKYENITHN